MLRSIKTYLYKRFGKRYSDDEKGSAQPRPPEEAYLYDSEGYALCDAEGYLLDTLE